MKKKGNKGMPTPKQTLIHNPIPTSLLLFKVSIVLAVSSSTNNRYISERKKRCSDGIMIVVTSTELVNISFSPTIEHDVGDVVRPNTHYTIRVQIVEVTSGAVIDEMITVHYFY